MKKREKRRGLSICACNQQEGPEGVRAKHPPSESPLDVWYRLTLAARWTSIVEVRKTFPHADMVGKCTVFNIAGNHYRLIAEINFKSQTVFVRAVLTRKEYDTDRWKDGC